MIVSHADRRAAVTRSQPKFMELGARELRTAGTKHMEILSRAQDAEANG